MQSALDANTYASGIRISDEQMEELSIRRDESTEWNYTILPRNMAELECYSVTVPNHSPGPSKAAAGGAADRPGCRMRGSTESARTKIGKVDDE